MQEYRGVQRHEQRGYGPVEVPQIGVPFPVRSGPYAELVQKRHMQWADEHGVFHSELERRRFSAMDIGALVSLLHPEASGPGDARLVADWCAWLLLRDDRWDSTDNPVQWERLAELDRAYLRLMRQSSLPVTESTNPAAIRANDPDGGEGLYGALADLLERLRTRGRQERIANPVDRRLVAVMREFFFASIRETSYQRRGECPALSEYIEMRSVTGGLDILTFVLAALDGVRLPKRLLEQPSVRRLSAASHNICCWHNDMVSLNKELASGEVHNLVIVLQQDPETTCTSLPEAVDVAERMILEEIETFVELGAEVRSMEGSWGSAAEWYERMLRNRVGGVIIWHEACAARYREAIVRRD
ncbi:terpene synthase family protein [Rubrobacter aplysinae]|uniref:terpene synthase family protein n=1 Tax=Rubrobacter aplysinae TaxID=909625 RepID=UPI00064C2DC9|nr:hypothetical protein [Rubrobacter aplysinae]